MVRGGQARSRRFRRSAEEGFARSVKYPGISLEDHMVRAGDVEFNVPAPFGGRRHHLSPDQSPEDRTSCPNV